MIERVTAFANKQVARLTWLRQRGGHPPVGKEGADYALDAIKKLFESEERGTRAPKEVERFDTERMFRHLCGIVRSDISTDVEGKENRKTIRPSDGDDWERESETLLLDLMTVFANDEEAITAIEMFIDGATDIEVKAKLGLTRTGLRRLKERLQAAVLGHEPKLSSAERT